MAGMVLPWVGSSWGGEGESEGEKKDPRCGLAWPLNSPCWFT